MPAYSEREKLRAALTKAHDQADAAAVEIDRLHMVLIVFENMVSMYDCGILDKYPTFETCSLLVDSTTARLEHELHVQAHDA